MKNKIRGAFLIFFLLVTYCSYSTVNLPAIFCDHMVLQQQSNVAIWGDANPESEIEVITSWNQKKYMTNSNALGKWKVKVETPEAGGPYSILISDGTLIELSDVLIGEVWVCSGQSNMEMPVKGFHNQPVCDSNEAIAKSRNESIRLFSVAKDTSSVPLNSFKGEWKECIPGNVANFSATAYFFGEMLQETLKVPVGLISSSWSGSGIQAWLSEESSKSFDFSNVYMGINEPNRVRYFPTLMYNAMINPMVGYGIKGVIWYQGEANRKEPNEYLKLLPMLIENWRDKWDIGNFYFYYAQIAPFRYFWDKNTNSAFLREAQLKTSTLLPNIGMACLMDVGEKSNIHPKKKKVVGERLAFQALANTYGMKGIADSGPTLKEMTINDTRVILSFKHAENGLTTFGKELINFKIAGEDKVFYQAIAKLQRNGTIVLSADQVKEPIAVRYAFEDFVVGELYNTAGLPASSFRTDNWEK